MPDYLDPETVELALSFVNTLSRTGDSVAQPPTLRSWIERTDAISGAGLGRMLAAPSSLRAIHAEALRLRSALRRIFGARARGERLPEPEAHALNRVLGAASLRYRMEPDGESLRIRHEPDFPYPESVLAPIALAAARVLADVPAGRLRECDAPDCPEWFVDTSKGGRRRWCSMDGCGNRRKAARHRAKVARTTRTI